MHASQIKNFCRVLAVTVNPSSEGRSVSTNLCSMPTDALVGIKGCGHSKNDRMVFTSGLCLLR